MVHFAVYFWKSHFSLSKWQWPVHKWSWCANITQSIISNVLLTSSLVGAIIYFYITSRRTARRTITDCASNTQGVPAMVNLGNTCYANSLLQGLASSKIFLKWLHSVDHKLGLENHELIFLNALKQIIQDLNNSVVETCSASKLIDALLAHRWSIPPNTEQDLFELFNVFVTTWDEELAALRLDSHSPLQKIILNEPKDRKISDSLGSTNITRSTEAMNLAQGDVKSIHNDASSTSESSANSTSVIQSLGFHSQSFEHVKNIVEDEKLLKPPCVGQLAVQLCCCREDCFFKKIREEKFCVLSLSLPKIHDPMLTLSNLLDKYFAAEYIRGASCDRCVERERNSSGGLMRKQGFCKLPALLILRIERVGFSSSGHIFKRNERFCFPEFIDIRQYCFFLGDQDKPKQLKGSSTSPYFRVLGGSALNASSSSSLITPQLQTAEQASSNGKVSCFDMLDNMFKYKYQLRAVCVHIGQAHSGHFVTYRRGIGVHNRTNWYKTSDAEVTPVSFSEVASSEAYMLFYERTLTNLK